MVCDEQDSFDYCLDSIPLSHKDIQMQYKKSIKNGETEIKVFFDDEGKITELDVLDNR